jgi:hypothetical protein
MEEENAAAALMIYSHERSEGDKCVCGYFTNQQGGAGGRGLTHEGLIKRAVGQTR